MDFTLSLVYRVYNFIPVNLTLTKIGRDDFIEAFSSQTFVKKRFPERQRGPETSTKKRLFRFRATRGQIGSGEETRLESSCERSGEDCEIPVRFLSLRWFLSDEIANVALHLRKLVGSNHPLLKTAKLV